MTETRRRSNRYKLALKMLEDERERERGRAALEAGMEGGWEHAAQVVGVGSSWAHTLGRAYEEMLEIQAEREADEARMAELAERLARRKPRIRAGDGVEPCPVCGWGTELAREDGWYCVRCRECGIRSPLHREPSECVADWRAGFTVAISEGVTYGF